MQKYLVVASLSVLLVGCASTQNTDQTIQGLKETYQRCVITSSASMRNAPESAIDIATVAANLCEDKRWDVIKALEAENKMSMTGNVYAGAYGDGLKRSTIALVAGKIMETRSK